MKESNSLEETIEAELNVLKEKNILEPADTIQEISSDHNESREWADGFWRRKTRHESRPDPEVEIVFDLKPKSTLEIGAGYGRILKKLSQEREKRKMNTELVGIEKCTYLESYFKKFQAQEPLLADVTIYYDNFFNSTHLKGKTFDVIVLPMNTFPAFGEKEIPLLFQTVKKYLTKGGRFIFSSYNFPEDISNKKLMKENYGGEILLEVGENPIILEFYRFTKLVEHFGVEEIIYLIYYRFKEYYTERKKYIYRKKGYLSRKEQIKQIIKENKFTIQDIIDKRFSVVFVCTNE